MAKDNKYIQMPLDEIADQLYKEYGLATLEDRAIGDYRDGCITVYRRVLYSAYMMGLHSKAKHVKSARIVGDTLGKFHPHGDKSVYDAMVTLTNRWQQVPLFNGQGNWGSLTDGNAAHYRYTEARLTKFSDEVLFNSFYLPVVDYVPTFDGAGKEPLILPALLPIVLINGQFGIAVAATTNQPSFEYSSVLKALKAIYEGQDVEAKFLYQTLKFRTVFGGAERKLDSKEQKTERLDAFTTVKGKVTLWSNTKFDGKYTVTADQFAINSLENILDKLKAIPGVTDARDDSSKKDKFGALTVILKKGLTTKDTEKVVRRVDSELSTSKTFNQNRTERYIDDKGRPAARVVTMSITKMLVEWVKWRTELEKKACTYWIGEDDKAIRRLELLMLAVDNRKLIIESLDREGDRVELDTWLAKKLKISVDEAHFIYELRIFQLRKLERKSLEAQKKEVLAHKKGLEARRKKPEPHMAKQLDEFAKLVA